MTQYDKPLPDVSDLTRPFWLGARERKLVLQKCDDCQYVRWPPRRRCPQCLANRGQWVPIDPFGTLYSYGTYHRAFDPRFIHDIPYMVGYIELAAGPRMVGMLVGEENAPSVGAAVRAVFRDVTRDITLVDWKVASISG